VLAGQPAVPDTWQAMGEHAATAIEPPDDTHGSSEYRRRLTATLVSRALAEASERIQAEASERSRSNT
jgi:aerobic carbon-monoxide dehydrogenase medium subunit